MKIREKWPDSWSESCVNSLKEAYYNLSGMPMLFCYFLCVPTACMLPLTLVQCCCEVTDPSGTDWENFWSEIKLSPYRQYGYNWGRVLFKLKLTVRSCQEERNRKSYYNPVRVLFGEGMLGLAILAFYPGVPMSRLCYRWEGNRTRMRRKSAPSKQHCNQN